MVYRVAISVSSFSKEDPTPLQTLEQAGVKIVENPYGRKLDEAEITKHLVDIDGLIAGLEALNSSVLTSAVKLKAIARVGIGMENIDSAAAKKLNIRLSNTPDGPTEAVAEMTLSALLLILRKILLYNSNMHNSFWDKQIATGLKGTKVLIVGYGRIGRRVAYLLDNFGADVMVTDPFVEEETNDEKYKFVSMHDGLRMADVITLHTNATETLLDSYELSLVKDGVIILNSSRGILINEAALIKGIRIGKVSNVWIDTYCEEPYYGELLNVKEAILTPHISTYTKQCRLSMELAAVNNLLRDLNLENAAQQ